MDELNPDVRWGRFSPYDLERSMLTMSFLFKLSRGTNAYVYIFLVKK
jgi:hypothetical protein